MLSNQTRGRGGLSADPRKPLTRAGRLAASSLILTFAMAADAPKQKAASSPPQPAAKDKDKGAGAERDPDRVALSSGGTSARTAIKPDLSTKAAKLTSAATIEESATARALRIMADCQAEFEKVKDYTCTFTKRERINGKLSGLNIISMKARNAPRSVYLRFEQPYKGREAIYVEGRNKGHVLAHDVGLNKFLAGTLELEPRSERAMRECRHPITEAGIGALIQTVSNRWAVELRDSESVVLFDSEMAIGKDRCLLIEAIHPERRPNYVFHKVRLFIDSKLGIPVRFEGYDWPKSEGGEAELVEEYAYGNLKLNVGLAEHDFDTSNRLYSFGRF